MFANDDGRGERTRRSFCPIGYGVENGVENVVGRLVGVSPNVDVFELDTVSGGGAGPEFGGWIQLLIMDVQEDGRGNTRADAYGEGHGSGGD